MCHCVDDDDGDYYFALSYTRRLYEPSLSSHAEDHAVSLQARMSAHVGDHTIACCPTAGCHPVLHDRAAPMRLSSVSTAA